MFTNETYDEYLDRQQQLASISRALQGCDEHEGLERCAYCGDYYLPCCFGDYHGERMCLPCVELERGYEAERVLEMMDYDAA